MNDSSHSHRITGQQARQLLDEATQGPWETGPGMDFMRSRIVFDTVTDGRGFTTSHVLADVTRPGDADLIAAAPALAETVAWLYGRKPDGHKHTWEDIPAWRITGDSDYMEDDVDVWVPRYGGRITVDRIEGNLTPKQAVELARALLAAAEEARS